MAQVNVRQDWLLELVKKKPEWQSVVQRVIELNAFFVVPAKYCWKDENVQDDDLCVLESGVKGPPSAFRFTSGKVICVNYPDSYHPMTESEFIAYIVGKVGK